MSTSNINPSERGGMVKRVAIYGVVALALLGIGRLSQPGCDLAKHIISCDDCGVAALNAVVRTQKRIAKQNQQQARPKVVKPKKTPAPKPLPEKATK